MPTPQNLYHFNLYLTQLRNAIEANLYPLRGKVVRYDDPTEPVALEDWEVLQ